MKISTEFQAVGDRQRLLVHREPDQNDLDRASRLKGQLGAPTVYVDLLAGDLKNTHPDLIALTCLLATEPFTDREIEFDFPVSEGFKLTLCHSANGPRSPNGHASWSRRSPHKFRETLFGSFWIDFTSQINSAQEASRSRPLPRRRRRAGLKSQHLG